MRNRQKKLALLLAATLTLSLAACGGTDASGATAETGAASETTQAAPTAEPTPEPVEAFPGKGTIEETVLVDESGVKVTATSLEYEEGGALLGLKFENNTDQVLHASVSDCSINGYMYDAYSSIEAEPGQTGEDSIYLSANRLYQVGVTDIAEIMVGIQIYSGVSYDNYLTADPVTIQTSLYGSLDESGTAIQALQDENVQAIAGITSVDYLQEEEIYNHNGVRVTGAAVATYGDGTTDLLLDVVNDNTISAKFDLLRPAVNNLLTGNSGFANTTILPGKRMLYVQPLLGEDPGIEEIYGLTEVGSVSVFARAYTVDMDSMEASDDLTELTFAVSDTVPPIDTTGDELFNESGVRIINKGKYSDPDDDTSYLVMLVENNTGHTIQMVDSEWKGTINGTEGRLGLSTERETPGQYAMLAMGFDEDELAQFGLTSIDEITDISINVRVENCDPGTGVNKEKLYTGPLDLHF